MSDQTTITGTVKKVLLVQNGTSKAGKDWSKQTFVIETAGQYPKDVAFEIWSGKIDAPAEGETLTVYFNPESREYNGRYFTDLKAWKVETDGNAPAQNVSDAKVVEVEEESELPF